MLLNQIPLFILVSFICLFNQTTGVDNKGKQTCEEQLKVIDRIGRMLLLMTKDQVVPKNPQIHKEWCKLTLSVVKKVAQYGKCEKLFPAQVLSILASGIRKPIRYVCIEEKQKSMEVYDCMTPEFFEKVNIAERYLLYSLKHMALNASNNDILPLFCCTYMDFFRFLKSELPSIPCSREDISPAKFFYTRVKSGLADMVDLVCGGYPNIEACETKAPEQVKVIRRQPPEEFDFYGEPVMKYVLGAVAKMS